MATHDQIEVIRDNRESLMRNVTERSDVKAREFGMSVVDVRIVGADFPPEVATSVLRPDALGANPYRQPLPRGG